LKLRGAEANLGSPTPRTEKDRAPVLVSPEMPKPLAIDLFCGAGGLSAGLVRSGWSIVGAIDSWEPAVQSYALNFSHPVRQLDLSIADADSVWQALGCDPVQVDLVAGGPPCQGFSVQRIGPDVDERNDLVVRFARLVAEMQPRMFLMENVPGLLGSRGRATAARFESHLSNAGYSVEHELVNAADFGVPQNRKRILYYGWLAGTAPFVFPQPLYEASKRRTVNDAIGDLPSPPADNTPTPGDSLHRRSRLSETNVARLRHIPPGGGFESLPIHLRVNAHKQGATRIGHRYVYGRLDPDKPASTITARFDSFTRGRFAHPSEDRNITLREGARLQSFHDRFCFQGTQEEIAAMIGNAVPPLLAEIAGRALLSHLAGGPASKAAGSAVKGRQLELTLAG
jgi:DNA (cytosine-5)-methyltransferase 1